MKDEYIRDLANQFSQEKEQVIRECLRDLLVNGLIWFEESPVELTYKDLARGYIDDEYEIIATQYGRLKIADQETIIRLQKYLGKSLEIIVDLLDQHATDRNGYYDSMYR